MLRLHTQWTTEFAVRMVQPIEDWLNYSCPIVPRRWLVGERTARHFLELELNRVMVSVEKDYAAQMERELADWPGFVGFASLETIPDQKDQVIHIEFAPRHRFIPLRDYSGHERSPEFFKYLTKMAGDQAKRDVEKVVADALARMQTKEAVS